MANKGGKKNKPNVPPMAAQEKNGDQPQVQQVQPSAFVVPVEILDKILNFLSTCPYAQVAPLLAEVARTEFKPVFDNQTEEVAQD